MVSSPSDVGVWISVSVVVGGGVMDRFMGCDTSLVSMRGGMSCGECADFSMKGVKLVDTLIVFIMSKCTFGRALTQPI